MPAPPVTSPTPANPPDASLALRSEAPAAGAMSQGAAGVGGGPGSSGSNAMYHVVPGGSGRGRRRRLPSRQPRALVALAALGAALVAAAVALWVLYAASARAAGERAVGRLVLSAGGLVLRGAGDAKPVLRVVFGRERTRATLGTLGSGCAKRRPPDGAAGDDADADGGGGGGGADDGSYSYDDDWPTDDGECVHGEGPDARVSVKAIDVGAAAAAAASAAAGNTGDAPRLPAECYGVTWTASRPGAALEDCVVLGDALWYGGAQMRVQRWPLEFPGAARDPVAYVPEDVYSFRDRYGAVMERYWLSSRGAYVFVADDVPLYVGWATVAGAGPAGEKALCLRAEYGADGPYRAPSNASRAFLHYEVCAAGDARAAHALASARHLGAPSAPPDERTVRCPAWSTWALHKRRVSQAKVVALAEAVVAHGFNHSHLQVDDGYEAAGRYGDYDFDPRSFPDPAAMVRDLRARLGFRLTLWVHPFVNCDADAFRAGVAKGLFVQTAASNADAGDDGAGSLTPALVRWWRGVAAVLDVTNPAAVDAFVNRTLRARLGAAALGFDSFKFDGGEASYLPRGRARTRAALANPAWFSARYAALAAHFGPLAEVRVAFRTHGLSAFVRVADRDSAWTHELGLRSLIPTALTFGLLGYPYVLPGAVGGNPHGEGAAAPASGAGREEPEAGDVKKPERELYIRWLELSAFMPAMQFSVPPWLYDEEVVAIARKFTALREEVVAPVVMAVARAAVARAAGAAAAASSSSDGNDAGRRGAGPASKAASFSPPTPMIVRPLWWAAPRDRVALRVDSQFLLGDAMLVAPVLEPNARARDVYLPAGTWCARMGGGGSAGDASAGGRCHPGQNWLRNFKVALDEVAYFVRKS